MVKYRESTIKLDGALTIDEFGMAHGRARVARVGVQDYMINGRKVRELRSVKDVMDSVASFNNLPVTLNHPSQGLVTASNAKTEMKGFMTKVEFQDGWMVTDIHITHSDAVEAAQTTHNKFSNGYLADIVMLDSPQTWMDELGVMGEVGKTYDYDAYQTNIVGNHTALVENPRAGKDATFISDESEVIIIDCDNKPISLSMPKLNTDESTLTQKEIVKEVVYSISIADTNYEIAGQDASKVVSAVSALSGKIDGLEIALKEANEKIEALGNVKTDESLISKEVETRTAIWALVKPYLDSEVDYSLTELEVKKLYLAKATPELAAKFATADTAYIEGVWDIKKPEPKKDAKDLNQKVITAVLNQNDNKENFVADQDNEMETLKKNLDAVRANYFNKKPAK